MNLTANLMNKLAKNLLLIAFLSILPATLFAQDAESLTETCVACHGKNGISPNDLWPNLAGQQHRYLVNQMIAYRDKTRDVPTMWVLVKDLTDIQIETIAKHYSEMPYPEPTSDQPMNTAGQNVRAYCVSCHGLSGNTVVSEWPNLAGQKKDYIAQQLMAYKSGERQHPLMNVIANELEDQHIADVAEYYSQIGIEPVE